MEYSFSQTFGKGANVLQCSPTPSFHSSNKAASRSRSRSRSIEGPNDHSPVLQSYPIRPDPGHSTFTDYIHRLSEQTRSYSQLTKTKQQMHKEAEAKLQAEIRNVDGLNERMVNLINSLKKEYSLGKNGDGKGKGKEFGSTGKVKVEAGIESRIERSFSTNLMKKWDNPVILSKQNYQRNTLRTQNAYDNSIISKKLLVKEPNRQKIPPTSEVKLKYKYKIEEKLNRKQQFQSDKQNRRAFQRNQYENVGKNQEDSLEKYALKSNTKVNRSDKKEIKNNYVDIKGKTGGSWNEPILKPASTGNQGQKIKSMAFFRQKEPKQQSWLKSKVKTIESEMETNNNDGQDFDNEDGIHQFQEYSYIQQNGDLKGSIEEVAEEEGESIYDRLGEKPEKDLNAKCENCGLHRAHKETGSDYDSNVYRSIEFENKLKKISEKIENYQKKVNGTGFDTAKYGSKQIQSLESTKSLPFTKRKAKETEEPKKKDPILVQQTLQSTDYQRHERKYTPTWSYQLEKPSHQMSTNFNSLMDSMDTEKSKKTSKVESRIQTERGNSGSQAVMGGLSLKERMSHKLVTSNAALRLSRQIQLDQEFRKTKKELSKLPEDIPGLSHTKWQLLHNALASRMPPQSMPIASVRLIFQLTDEQADPFYSIAVEDLHEYQQVIEQAVEAFLSAETYFNENIKYGLAWEEVRKIFEMAEDGDDGVRIDQFALLISNTTKANHKCRDVWLLFQRILAMAGGAGEAIGKRELMKLLATEEQKRSTLRIKPSENSSVNWQHELRSRAYK